jgi:hypothetical protein
VLETIRVTAVSLACVPAVWVPFALMIPHFVVSKFAPPSLPSPLAGMIPPAATGVIDTPFGDDARGSPFGSICKLRVCCRTPKENDKRIVQADALPEF